MKRPVIVLTGGGTAGHVSVNEALIPVFADKGYEVHYIGSHDGIELELIGERHPEVEYHAIQSGKLRRYFSLKNFTDPFKVGAGVLQAYSVLRKLKPDVVFSKGGFVSVPVVMAAKLARIPVVIHESDVTPGLANKLALPMSNHIFTVFEETLQHVPGEKSTCTGPVIRPELFSGSRTEGLRLTGLPGQKPVVLFMGGSQGSVLLNDSLRTGIDKILEMFEVIHLCGKGHMDESLADRKGYAQFEYATDSLPHLLAAADLAVSRAGSNSIFELLALRKPMLLIPLSAAKSRGDQILNAKLFKSLRIAEVVTEEELEGLEMQSLLARLLDGKAEMEEEMKRHSEIKTPESMVDLILSYKN